MRCGSYKTISASQSFVLQIIVYCVSSHFDYDEITSPSFVMKQHQVYVSWYLVIYYQFHLTRISRFPVQGLNFIWASHGVAVELIGGAVALDHNELDYSSPTNLLQDIHCAKVHENEGTVDMGISHSNSSAGGIETSRGS